MSAVTKIETVTLVGCGAVALAALQLVWLLEDRGLDIRLDLTGRLLVGPQGLSDIHKRQIADHRDELCRLVQHCEGIQ